MEDNPFMEEALRLARLAADQGEVPVGAVIADDKGQIIARAYNRTEADRDATAHAELLALRDAMRVRGDARLAECTLFVTLEPCPMCAGAIQHARLKRLVYGAYDPKGGAIDHGARLFDQATCLHRPEIVGGVREADSAALLKAFFLTLR
ncbi:MAG: nucleoside deaminase [Magnetovibrionaceae bacterium]